MIKDISAEESPMRGSILSVCISFCPRLHWRSYWILLVLFYLFGSIWRKDISQLRNPLWGNPHNLYDDYIKRFWDISRYLSWRIPNQGIHIVCIHIILPLTDVLFGSYFYLFGSFWREQRRDTAADISQLRNLQWGYIHILYVNYFAPGSTVSPQR